MEYNINFPHLHIYLGHVGQELSIAGFSIRFYGIVLAVGMLCGILIASWMAKRTGQMPEDYVDLALIAIVCSIIGARIYYVAFRWEFYRDDPLSVFRIREGGLAIYGGVLAAILTTFVFCRIKRLNFGLVCDTAGLGLVLGQAIGRWGNFFNREAFGGYTDNLLAMQLPLSAVRADEVTAEQMEKLLTLDGVGYIQVHPTFLYESVWNLALLVILILYTKHKRFDGQVFLLYLFGYGVGRFWIEGLRTDQLLIPGIGYPVSRALAAVLAVTALVWFFLGGRRIRERGEAADK